MLYDEYGDPYANQSIGGQQPVTPQPPMYSTSEGYYEASNDAMSEDRQWDSSGRGTSMNKTLPKIPIKHSSSVSDDIYHRDGMLSAGGMVGGLLLPPTPLATLAALASGGPKKSRQLPQPQRNTVKALHTSLPTTPRMLPPMPLRQKAQRQSAALLLKRSDTEYSDQESLHSAYSYRPGAVSAINYNEDYNYAYQSTDSLNQSFSETGMRESSGNRRKGAALPTPPTISNKSKIPRIGVSTYQMSSLETDVSYPHRLPIVPTGYAFTNPNKTDLSMYDDSVDVPDDYYSGGLNGSSCYDDQPLDASLNDEYYDDEDEYDHCTVIVDEYADDPLQPPPARKSKRLPMPTKSSRLPPIPSGKTMPASAAYATSSYDDQYDDYENDSGGYMYSVTTATTSITATTTSSDYSVKVSSYDSSHYGQPVSDSYGSAYGGSGINGGIGSSVDYYNSNALTSTTHQQISNTTTITTPSSVLNSLNNKYSAYVGGYGGASTAHPSVTTTTTSVTVTTASPQILSGGITTLTKTLSSIFASKPAPAAAKPTLASQRNQFQQNQFRTAMAQPKPSATAKPTDLYNNYNCDEEYYSNISAISTITTPPIVTAPHGGESGADGGLNSTTSTTTSATIIHSVDYSSDDYKYNYDDYSYSENDYIATGDITNVKNHYNNNYADYGGGGDDAGGGGGEHHPAQQQIDNISYSFCDNSSNNSVPTNNKTVRSNDKTGHHVLDQSGTGNVVSTQQQQQHQQQAANSLNSIGISSNRSSLVYTTTSLYTNGDHGDMGGSSGTITTAVTTASDSITPAQQGYKSSGKSNQLMKQDPTEMYDDEDEDDYMRDGYGGTAVENTSTIPVTSMSEQPLTSIGSEYYTTNPPYYNYQEDYFNEEDEYKYLEKEREEEAECDEYEDEELEEEEELEDDEATLDAQLRSGRRPYDQPSNETIPTTIATTVPSLSKKPGSCLAAQESIDDNEFFMKHSKNILTLSKQHGSIREEDEPPSDLLTPIAEYGAAVTTTTSVSSTTTGLGTAAPSLLLATTTATTTSSIIGGITATTAAAAMAAATTTMNHIADIGGTGVGADLDMDIEIKKKPTTLLDELTSGIGVVNGVAMSGGGMRKTEITAKQRWNWAYNKIIMQLNVSREHFFYYCSFKV